MLFRIFVFLVLWLIAAPTASPQQSCIIETFAGGDATPGDGGPATQAPLLLPWDGAITPEGIVYFLDLSAAALRMIDGAGTIDTLLERDDVPSAENFTSLTLGLDGSIYFADVRHVWRRFPDGRLERVAGNGAAGSPKEGVLAVDAPWIGSELTTGPDGSLYFLERDRHRVRRISPEGLVLTVAGASQADERGRFQGGFSGDGGPAVDAELNQPRNASVGPDGSIYISDSGNRRIRKVRPDGVIETLAFLIETPPQRVEVDGLGIVHATLTKPGIYRILQDGSTQLEADAQVRSDIFFAGPNGEIVWLDQTFRLIRLKLNGGPEVLAGTGVALVPKAGQATQTYIGPTYDIEFGPNGDLYIAGSDRVLAVSPDGTLRIVAGGGTEFFDQPDGMPATDVRFFALTNIAVNDEGRVYVLEQSGANRILAVERDGTVTRVAGRGYCGAYRVCGIGGPANQAALSQPRDPYAGPQDTVYFIDQISPGRPLEDQILVVSGDGNLYATPPTPGIDACSATKLSFATGGDRAKPVVVATLSQGCLETLPPFQQLQPDWSLVVLPASSGFANPNQDAAVGGDGSIYFLTDDHRLRKALPDGRVVTIAGVAGRRGYAGDGGPAKAALLRDPDGLALGADGALYISDTRNGRIRRILNVASCDDAERPEIAIRGVVSAADFVSFSPFVFAGAAPGEIFSIFGRGLGPGEPLLARVEAGRVATELGGVRVLVDGVPAPLTFVSSNQINAILPYATPVRHDLDRDGLDVDLGVSLVEVEFHGVRSEASPVNTRATRPSIFLVEPGVSQRGAIFNQDGTLNGPENPAKVGSVVVLYATGEGETDPPGVDGLLAVGALPTPVAPVTIRVGDVEASVLYAGGAPTFTAGLMQANARIEPGTASGQQQLTLRIGGSETGAPIWIAP